MIKYFACIFLTIFISNIRADISVAKNANELLSSNWIVTCRQNNIGYCRLPGNSIGVTITDGEVLKGEKSSSFVVSNLPDLTDSGNKWLLLFLVKGQDGSVRLNGGQYGILYTENKAVVNDIDDIDSFYRFLGKEIIESRDSPGFLSEARLFAFAPSFMIDEFWSPLSQSVQKMTSEQKLAFLNIRLQRVGIKAFEEIKFNKENKNSEECSLSEIFCLQRSINSWIWKNASVDNSLVILSSVETNSFLDLADTLNALRGKIPYNDFPLIARLFINSSEPRVSYACARVLASMLPPNKITIPLYDDYKIHTEEYKSEWTKVFNETLNSQFKTQ